jgi:hypothetical protein
VVYASVEHATHHGAASAFAAFHALGIRVPEYIDQDNDGVNSSAATP